MNWSSISVIGLGYIGLPTAVMFADAGVDVHGVDVDPRVADTIRSGAAHIVEPDLDQALKRVHDAGRLHASTVPQATDAYLIAVPTPFTADLEPNLSYIKEAASAIAPLLVADSLVILESTSPPGATRQLAKWISDARPDLDISGSLTVDIAYCPERVLPGKVMTELITNDRIIGGLTPRAAERAADLYGLFCRGELLLTDATTAEMCKLAENAFRDVNIAFANELSLISETVGVDVWELIELANHHPRVNILQPGPGVGGHCIAVDPWFLVAADRANTRLIKTAREVNDDKPTWVVSQVLKAVEGAPGPRIAALGLAFKPNIDDLRESPARAIVARLAELLPSASISVVEPHIDHLPPDLASFAQVELCDLPTALQEATCVVLLVDHDAFAKAPDAFDGVVIDTRGAWR